MSIETRFLTQEPGDLNSDVKRLPPLILHPFAEANDPSRLMESSRAALTLQGLLPELGQDREELDRAQLDGQYCEMRMLFYVGRDVMRWIEQCLEVAARVPSDYPAGVCRQSFAAYLVNHSPQAVQDKLRQWGVRGYQRIFARALALNYIFAQPPEMPVLAHEFIRTYHRHADQIFARDQEKRFPPLDPAKYSFDLYASGEYARMLEREWEE
jgi:hypothetical protein